MDARPPPALPGPAAELAKRLHEHLPDLRKRYGIKSLALFGSYARGDQRPESDLDVLVEFEVAPHLIDLIELENQLAALLDVKADLVLKRALKPRIRQRVLREAVEI